MAAVDPRSIRMIWTALLMSVVFYGGIAWFLVPHTAATAMRDAYADATVLALHIAGIGALIMSFVVSNALARKSRGQAMIIRWAMTEMVAVFGLLAAFLRQDARLFFPLGALAVAAMFVSYPSEERLLGPTP